MTKLEDKLQKEVGDTLLNLASASPLQSCSGIQVPAVKLVRGDVLKYRDGRLFVPLSEAGCEQAETDARKTYVLGQFAGLVLLYHGNERLRHLFDAVAHFGERGAVEPEPAVRSAYAFWSQMNMAYAGLLALALKKDEHVAHQQVVRCRALLIRDAKEINKDSEPEKKEAHACLVGSDYAAQIYLRHGRQKFAKLLGMHDVHDVHELVSPNEDFASFIIRDWK